MEKTSYSQIIQLGISNQFTDSEYGFEQNRYNRWVKDSKKSFLKSIPTASLLFGDNHIQYLYPQFSKYTIEQLSEPLIGNLSAQQIAILLDSMDLYTIMSLISDDDILAEDKICQDYCNYNMDVDVNYYGVQNEYSRIDYLNVLTKLRGTFSGNEIYSYPFQISTRSDRSISIKPYHIKHIYGHNFGNGISANEVLFRFLRLPVSVVLGSINEINFRYDSGLPVDEDLCAMIERINSNKPDKYKILSLIRK